MTPSNEKKNKQLGMPHGTASSQLRKSILFYLATMCNLTTCYRCSNIIQNIEEFSIEHKEAWLDSDNPKEKFFDLDNIAFSHLKCNIGSANKPNKKYYTQEDKILSIRERVARNTRKWYTPEKRRLKYLTTGK